MSNTGGRLLAVHPGALGDVILFGHLLSAVRQGGQTVTLVAGGEKARLLQTLGVVDEALDFERLAIGELFADSPGNGLATQLGALACDQREQPRNAQASVVAPLRSTAHGTRVVHGIQVSKHTRVITCFAEEALTRFASIVGATQADYLPIRPPADHEGHLLDLWTRRLGIERPAVSAWQVPPAVRDEAADLLKAVGIEPGRFIAMHVGGGSPEKCWPMAAYAECARGLALPVVFLAGPVERDRVGQAALAETLNGFPLLADLPLRQLAGILASASAFLGNDSGPAHLAATVGTPTLVLFGPTNPAHFAPQGPSVQSLHVCPISGLPVGRVATALGRLLDGYPTLG